ncbi:metal ABC transporter permease [Leptotrichia sp. OH3620_COT-345]|uniref:metal ABC transporter permease n=1 Tax=Leptotrichia sp. OH3620_COT-345 TaxID=2491048 RepID=UPI000F64D756|nr:metal ABC transporter permease [Leptotrichia sp. OH3620_COT-345]RRD40962.1 metal ABC transporter permease [Leptotrichia sp. OH3620_COT-345]
MSAGLVIQLIAIMVASSCSILGAFLVLKNMAMVSDAITHTILLGIVIAFFIVHDLSSPFLILGAGIVGVLTVYLVELLHSTRLVKEDSAIGVVFPLLFSIAVILISKYASNIHLDVDSVLLGELAFAPFNTVEIFGFTIAKGLIITFTVFVVNFLFVIIFFKELKISTFDKALAATLGMKPVLIHYMLMSLVSVTSVASFEAVGSILVVAFMIGPPITAYLITSNLKIMLFLSIILGSVSSVIGYFLAVKWDVSIAGMISVVIGVIFIIVLTVSPKKGLIFTFYRKKNQKIEFSVKMLLIHIFNHSGTPEEKDECGLDTMEYHLRWEKKFYNKILEKAKELKLIYIDNRIFKITDKGKEFLKQKL